MPRNALPPEPQGNVPHEPPVSETLERAAEEERREAERAAGTDERIRRTRERLRTEEGEGGEEETA